MIRDTATAPSCPTSSDQGHVPVFTVAGAPVQCCLQSTSGVHKIRGEIGVIKSSATQHLHTVLTVTRSHYSQIISLELEMIHLFSQSLRRPLLGNLLVESAYYRFHI